MSRHRTGASSLYGGGDGGDPSAMTPAGGPVEPPGLVLLYAPNFEHFHPAYVFNSPELVIGREASLPVCVPEQAVSRQHARIALRGDRWILTDLSSRNGTMVDGAFIGEIELEHLHEIRIGDAIFKFVEAGAPRYLGYRIDGGPNVGNGPSPAASPAASPPTPRRGGRPRDPAVRELVGGCQMDQIASDLDRIAPTQLSAIVLGETGTGKEVAARELHRMSGRRGSFQAINCAAIPQNLLESELFGYRRGAFSGADRDKPGLIKLADGGTLFLDEIGDMPLEAQAKLLRVLQSREVFPLGATTSEPVDIRVVCATHRDLYQYVREGKFRGDLFARLNEHTVKLPPLRERKEDIFQLARLFGGRYGRPDLPLSFSFLVALLHYDWPFNVRELESCIKRAVALSGMGAVDTQHLPDAVAEHMKGYGQRPRVTAVSDFPPAAGRRGDRITPPPPAPVPVPSGGQDGGGAFRRSPPTEAELRELLQAHHGNVAAVGRVFGKERMQVHRWLKKFGINLEDYRERP